MCGNIVWFNLGTQKNPGITEAVMSCECSVLAMTSHTQQLHSTQTKSVELGLEEHFRQCAVLLEALLWCLASLCFFLTACVVFFLTDLCSGCRLSSGLPALTFQRSRKTSVTPGVASFWNQLH